MGKRLWQYPEVTNIDSDDFLLLDNESDGSKCIKANKIGAVLIDKTVTERKTYTASDDSVNGYKKVIVDVPYTDVHYDKDDIVSFTGEDFPLKSLTADITALQDLHGYDYPWVGGAGKNKYSGGNVTVNNTLFADISVSPIPAGTYTISVNLSNETTNDVRVAFRKADGTAISATGVTYNASGRSVGVITTDETTERIYFYYGNSTSGTGTRTYTNIQIEQGSTATSWQPYSNICPISGWSAVDVTRCAKNLFDYTHFQFVDMGYINGYGVWEGSRTIKNYPTDNIGNEWNSLLIDVSALRSQNVSFSGFVGSTAIGIIDENFKVLYTMGTSVPTSGSVDLSQYPTAKYFVIGFYFIGYDFDNAQFELGTTTTYEPYNGNTYSLTFTDGSNPLTVYGGTVDLISGVLTVDRAYVDLGTLDWSVTNNHCFYSESISDLKIIDSASVVPNLMCSHYPTKTPSNAYNGYSGDCISQGISGIIGEEKILIYDSNYSDATAFKTAMNGVQLVYELATPLTYSLTKQQIKSLVGDNNIFADTGEVAVEWQTEYVTPSA